LEHFVEEYKIFGGVCLQKIIIKLECFLARMEIKRARMRERERGRVNRCDIRRV
jgi:hypothetical protein